jgi:TPR repeat protein
MIRRLFFIALLIAFSQSIIAQSEDVKTRLNKKEITDLMVQIGRMPVQQQNTRLAQILQDPAGSKTPRSDFTFCSGLAYWGNFKAQICIGNAYENGRGIVEDLSEAYTWYALALEDQAANEAEAKKAEAARDRVKSKLVSGYPQPTEDDLADLVNSQKAQIAQYQEQIKKAKN